MNDTEVLMEELMRRKELYSPHQIETARSILDKRMGKQKVVVPVQQCECFNSISCLNKDVVEWSPIEIIMYNFAQDDGALLQVRGKEQHIQDTIRIHYCPLCGRYLG